MMTPVAKKIEDRLLADVNAPDQCVIRGSSRELQPTLAHTDAPRIHNFVDEEVGPNQSVAFKNSPMPERVIIIFLAVAIFLFIQGSSANIVSRGTFGLGILSVFSLSLFFALHRYRSDPVLADSLQLKLQLKTISDQIKEKESHVKAAEREKMIAENRLSADVARIEKRLEALAAEEKSAIDASQKSLQAVLSSINQWRRGLNRKAADALQGIQSNTAAEVIALNKQTASLSLLEADELARALRVKQTQFVDSYLQSFAISDASIAGLEPNFESLLAGAGLQTAADIDVDRIQQIEGVTSTHAAALMAWRDVIEMRAQAKMPQALSQNEITAIRIKYERQRLSLQDERDYHQRCLVNKEDPVRRQYQNLRELLDVEQADAKLIAKMESDHIKAKHALASAALRDALSKHTEEIKIVTHETDGKISGARKELFSLYDEQKTLSQQLKALATVRFTNYVKRVF